MSLCVCLPVGREGERSACFVVAKGQLVVPAGERCTGQPEKGAKGMNERLGVGL